MTSEEVSSFLQEPGHLVRIGTIAGDGTPLVVPAWFVCLDNVIHVTARARSSWRHNLEANPKTCFTVDEREGATRYWTAEPVEARPPSRSS